VDAARVGGERESEVERHVDRADVGVHSLGGDEFDDQSHADTRGRKLRRFEPLDDAVGGVGCPSAVGLESIFDGRGALHMPARVELDEHMQPRRAVVGRRLLTTGVHGRLEGPYVSERTFSPPVQRCYRLSDLATGRSKDELRTFSFPKREGQRVLDRCAVAHVTEQASREHIRRRADVVRDVRNVLKGLVVAERREHL
jgi:hypothetical protein